MVKSYLKIKVFLAHWRVRMKALFADRAYRISLCIGFLLLFLSYEITLFASRFADSFTYPSVPDLILDKIPVVDLEFLFTYGIYFLVISLAFYVIFFLPERLPFVLKSYAFLYLVRSGFISLTGIGPPEGSLFANGVENANSYMISSFLFKNDLFFSGHTSTPFLAFLILRDFKFKWFMFFGTVVMGATVLLMHVHYSIDVFAAFFITHGIYYLNDRIFNNLNERFKLRIKEYSNKLKEIGGVAVKKPSPEVVLTSKLD